MASNQNVNKVVYAGTTLIDLTGDDVTAGDVLSGKKFHLPSGATATGTMPNIGAISGILKGDGAGNVSAATAGTDYLAPSDLTPYRTAAAQDVIDAGKEASGLGLTGASVGDLVRVNAVDANGKPTSWATVTQDEITKMSVKADELAIVINGNTSVLGAAEGQYVILRNSTISGITDGLYIAAQAIPANTAIDGTYLTAVSGGGLNALHQDTGWIDLSNYLTSSFSARPWLPPKVRIINGVYYFVGEIYHPYAITANQTIDAMRNIPSELRPSAQITAGGVTFSFVTYTMWITPTGELQIRPNNGKAQQDYEGFQMVYFSGTLK